MDLKIGDRIKWTDSDGIIYDILDIDLTRDTDYQIRYGWTDQLFSNSYQEIWCSTYTEILDDIERGRIMLIQRKHPIEPSKSLRYTHIFDTCNVGKDTYR